MTIPPVTIVVRSLDGRMKSPSASDVVAGSINHCMTQWSFDFFMMWLCRYCLIRAEQNAENTASADLWIERYRKLREIR